jgi:hypothetical protein
MHVLGSRNKLERRFSARGAFVSRASELDWNTLPKLFKNAGMQETSQFSPRQVEI